MATGEKDISCASSSLDSFWNMFIISLDSFECLGESDGCSPQKIGRVMEPQSQSFDPGKELQTLVPSRLFASHTVTELSPVLNKRPEFLSK